MSGLTLLLLLVALVVGVRLYWALGTRNKNYEEQRRAYRGLHERVRKAGSDAAARAKRAARPRTAAPAPAPKQGVAAGLEAIRAREPDFALPAFLSRAEKAYRLIVRLYAEGEVSKLRPLLSPSVYQDFRAGIAARRARGQRLVTEILSLGTPQLRAIKVEGARARITLAFDSDMISALYGPKGELLEGDANQALELRDLWCFERVLGAAAPQWRLTETETQPRSA